METTVFVRRSEEAAKGGADFFPGERCCLFFLVVVSKSDGSLVREIGVQVMIDVGRLGVGQCEVAVDRGDPVFDRGIVFDAGVTSGSSGFNVRRMTDWVRRRCRRCYRCRRRSGVESCCGLEFLQLPLHFEEESLGYKYLLLCAGVQGVGH
jgi:hypothetical protein